MPAHSRSGFARFSLLLGLAAFVSFASMAIDRLTHPRYSVAFSSSGYGRSGLGTLCNGVPDVVEVSPARESLTLAVDEPTIARINTAYFEVGYTGEPIQETYPLPRELSINGVTRALDQEMTIATGIYTDEL